MVKGHLLREKYNAQIKSELYTEQISQLDHKNHITMSESSKNDKLLQELEDDWGDDATEEEEQESDVDDMFGNKLLQSANNQSYVESSSAIRTDSNVIHQQENYSNLSKPGSFSQSYSEELPVTIRQSPSVSQFVDQSFAINTIPMQNVSSSGYKPRVLTIKKKVDSNLPSTSRDTTPTPMNKVGIEKIKKGIEEGKTYFLHKYKKEILQHMKDSESDIQYSQPIQSNETQYKTVIQSSSYNTYQPEPQSIVSNVSSPQVIQGQQIIGSHIPSGRILMNTLPNNQLISSSNQLITSTIIPSSSTMSTSNQSISSAGIPSNQVVSSSNVPLQRIIMTKPGDGKVLIVKDPGNLFKLTPGAGSTVQKNQEVTSSIQSSLNTVKSISMDQNTTNTLTAVTNPMSHSDLSLRMSNEAISESNISPCTQPPVVMQSIESADSTYEHPVSEIQKVVSSKIENTIPTTTPNVPAVSENCRPDLNMPSSESYPMSSSDQISDNSKDEESNLVIDSNDATREVTEDCDDTFEEDIQPSSQDQSSDGLQNQNHEVDTSMEVDDQEQKEKSPNKNLSMFPELKTNFKIPKKRLLDSDHASKSDTSDASQSHDENECLSPLVKKLKKDDAPTPHPNSNESNNPNSSKKQEGSQSKKDEHLSPNKIKREDSLSPSKVNKEHSKPKEDSSAKGSPPKSKDDTKSKMKDDKSPKDSKKKLEKKDCNDSDRNKDKDEHMKRLKLRAKSISKKIQEDLNAVIYSTFENRIQNDEILQLLQHPNPDKVSFTKVKDPHPGEFYVFNYQAIALDDISCDNLNWKNKGIKYMFEGENRIKKIYFQNLDHPSIKKKVSYFENSAKRKYLCVYYEEGEKMFEANISRPERKNTVGIYKTNVGEVPRDDIVQMLTKPEMDKVAKSPVKLAWGGDVIVYDLESISLDDCRNDSYVWQMYGARDVNWTEPTCKKINYSIVISKGKTSHQFRKKEYYMNDESKRKYAVVHYIGDDRIVSQHLNGSAADSTLSKKTNSFVSKIKCMAEISNTIKDKKKICDLNLDCYEKLKTESQLLKENSNAITILEAKKKLSANDIYNINLLAYNLKGFVNCLEVYPSFICVVGIENLLNDFNKILEVKTDKPLLCIYGEAYKICNYFVTPLYFHHIAFEEGPVVPLAFMIHHDCKQNIHSRFLQVLVDNIPNLSKTMVPFITKPEKDIRESFKKKLSFCPVLHQWKHVEKNLRSKLQNETISAPETYVDDLYKLLKSTNEKEYQEIESFNIKSWTIPLQNYYEEELEECITEGSAKWALEDYGCFKADVGVDVKECAEVKLLMNSLQKYKLVPIDVTVTSLYLLHNNILHGLIKSFKGEGKYKYNSEFSKDLFKFDNEKVSENLKTEDISKVAEKYSIYHEVLAKNILQEPYVTENNDSNEEKRQTRSKLQPLNEETQIRKKIVQSLLSSSQNLKSNKVVEMLEDELKKSCSADKPNHDTDKGKPL